MTDEKKDKISKNVYRHKWASLEDWIRSLDDLADLDSMEECGEENRQGKDDIYFE